MKNENIVAIEEKINSGSSSQNFIELPVISNA